MDETTNHLIKLSCSRRRKENPNSKNERHDANERKVRRGGNHESGIGLPHSTTSRTEWHARISRQRRGVRQPYAALTSVHWQAQIYCAPRRPQIIGPPYVGRYRTYELLERGGYKPIVAMLLASSCPPCCPALREGYESWASSMSTS